MNGKDLKSFQCLLRENNKKTSNVNKNKTEDVQITELLSKLENKLEVCSFVENCITKAQEKNDEECFEVLNCNQGILQPSMFYKI